MNEELTHCFPAEAGREFYVASVTKACVGKYDHFKERVALSKPLFNRFCGCLANGVADRITVGDLIKESDGSDLSKQNETIIGEETTRCLAVTKAPSQPIRPQVSAG